LSDNDKCFLEILSRESGISRRVLNLPGIPLCYDCRTEFQFDRRGRLIKRRVGGKCQRAVHMGMINKVKGKINLKSEEGATLKRVERFGKINRKAC